METDEEGGDGGVDIQIHLSEKISRIRITDGPTQ